MRREPALALDFLVICRVCVSVGYVSVLLAMLSAFGYGRATIRTNAAAESRQQT